MTGLRDTGGEVWIYVYSAHVTAVHSAEVFLLIKHVV